MGSMLGLLIRCSESASILGIGVDGSMLDPNHVIDKDVKSCSYCRYVRCATSVVRVRGDALAPNRRNSLPCTVRTSRQGSCNHRVSFLLCKMASNYDLWDVSLDKCMLRGLVPCCSQDCYRAQVPKHPIDSYRYIM